MTGLKHTLVCILVPLLLACDANLTFSNRSGTLDDDYVAEPLSEHSQKYATALETSNALIRSVAAGRYAEVYDQLTDPMFKQRATKDDFVSLLKNVEATAGEIVAFKELQWGFFTGTEEGEELLYSTKIVEHRNLTMKYLIVFMADSNYERISGFHAKVREGVSRPGQY